MANETDHLYKTFENLKTKVKESFDRIYAALKAREIETLRQLDVILKQCQKDETLSKQCVNDVKLRFDDEPNIIHNINDYGAIDFENLNLNSDIFNLDHCSAEHDESCKQKELNHKEEYLTSKKTIETSEHCSCCENNIKNIRNQTSDLENKISKATPTKNNIDYFTHKNDLNNCESRSDVNSSKISNNDSENSHTEPKNETNEESEIKKLNPTDDWLNSIKNQTEIEPTYFSDGLEHSDISCL